MTGPRITQRLSGGLVVTCLITAAGMGTVDRAHVPDAASGTWRFAGQDNEPLPA